MIEHSNLIGIIFIAAGLAVAGLVIYLQKRGWFDD